MNQIMLSRVILTIDELVVKIHVYVSDDKGGFHKEATYANKLYTRLDPISYITIENSRKEWSKDSVLTIVLRNIPIFIRTLKRTISHLYKEKIFYTEDSTIYMYMDMERRFDETICLRGSNNQYIKFAPAVIRDENEVTYEGVNMYINKLENVIPMSVDMLESLEYCLEKLDLFIYSQELINYYISYYNISSENPIDTSQPYNIKNITWESKPEYKPHVSSNFRKPVEDDVFNGLDSSK